MKIHGTSIYLNGIKMALGRKGPVEETAKFVEGVMSDLLSPNYGRKHKCSERCGTIWTIAIGQSFTDKDSFKDCIPRWLSIDKFKKFI